VLLIPFCSLPLVALCCRSESLLPCGERFWKRSDENRTPTTAGRFPCPLLPFFQLRPPLFIPIRPTRFLSRPHSLVLRICGCSGSFILSASDRLRVDVFSRWYSLRTFWRGAGPVDVRSVTYRECGARKFPFPQASLLRDTPFFRFPFSCSD